MYLVGERLNVARTATGVEVFVPGVFGDGAGDEVVSEAAASERLG